MRRRGTVLAMACALDIAAVLRANDRVENSVNGDGSVSGFRIGNRRLSGLHRFIDTKLSPIGKIRPWRRKGKDIRKISAVGIDSGKITKKGNKKGVRQAKATVQAAALSFGTVVHSQIEEFVQHGTPVTNNVAKSALDILEKGRFLPAACEVRVCCIGLGIGTAVDLICFKRKRGKVCEENVDRTKVYLVEIKTGYDGTFNCGFGHLYHKGKRIAKYSPKTRTNIQLALTRAMFEATYPEIPVAGTFVLLLQSKGSTLSPSKLLIPDTPIGLAEMGTSSLQWKRQ